MTPEAILSRTVAGVTEDPDEYFAERGVLLHVAERGLDSELPRKAPSRGSTHWADLISAKSGEIISRSYGSGYTEDEAKRRALERWVVEQEPPPALPHRLP
jgi:hypothetical protein